MLTKGAKITALATAAIFLLAMIGGFLNEKRKWQSVEYADSLVIFGINDVEYENEDGEPQEFFGKIKSLTLKDDTVLLNPTLKDIQKFELNRRGKHPVPMENASEYDAYGLLIDKDDLHD